MRWLLTVESAFFVGTALYLFATGSFWTAWGFVILAVIFSRAMMSAWRQWETCELLRERVRELERDVS